MVERSITIQSTVSFSEVAKFPKGRHFGAYLRAGDIIVCGGETEDHQLLKRFESISLADGKTWTKSLSLVTGAAKFDLHLLNIPKVFLKEETVVVQPFQVGDKVMLRPDEEHKRSPFFSIHTIPTPKGTGSITAIDYDSMAVTVNFPNVNDWRGTTDQLQHAP